MNADHRPRPPAKRIVHTIDGETYTPIRWPRDDHGLEHDCVDCPQPIRVGQLYIDGPRGPVHAAHHIKEVNDDR